MLIEYISDDNNLAMVKDMQNLRQYRKLQNYILHGSRDLALQLVELKMAAVII